MGHIPRDRGFSLVELMVAVLIIGVLVTVAVPAFNQAQTGAQKNTCWSNQRTIEGACQSYSATNGSLPPDLDALVPRFLQSTPSCPVSGVAYTIDASGTASNGGARGCAVASHGHY